MSLLQLPDDILFIILKFSKPHDLFRLRKTCKRLQALTLERTVWRAAYENSRCFLPAGPLHIQTVHNLEKILVRADRWDKIWKQDQRIGYTLGCIWSGRYGLHPNDRQHMELAYSRYLTISGLGNLRVYDLESKCEIFRYQAVGSETLSWFGYSPSAATEGDAASGIFTPFCRNTKLAFHRINSRGEVNFYNTKIDVADMSAILAVGHEFFIFKGRDASTTTSLLHIPSQKVYQLPSTLENEEIVDATILAGHVLVVHEIDSEQTCIRIFDLPDHNTLAAGSLARQTHSGILRQIYRGQLMYVSSDLSDQGNTVHIWLLMRLEASEEGLRPMRITLESNANLTFYLPDAPKCDPSALNPYFVEYRVAPGSRARAIGYLTSFYDRLFAPPRVALYDVYPDSNGNLQVDTSCIDVSPLSCPSEQFIFDPFVGLVCLREDGLVAMFDVVKEKEGKENSNSFIEEGDEERLPRSWY